MGTANSRSWSHARFRKYETCPRAFFFRYYWQDETEWKLLADLRRVTTVEALVGTIVHDMINIALRRFRASRVMPSNLHLTALGRYDNLVRHSVGSAQAICKGRRARSGGVVLLHHLQSGPCPAIEQAGRECLQDTLSILQRSTALEFITESDPKVWPKWAPLTTDTDELPYFKASPELGFRSAYGLKVYAVYDLVFNHDGDLIIVDWKTGKKTPQAVAAARKQMAIYSLWAISKKAAQHRIRIAPCFLIEDEPWHTEELTESDLDGARRAVEYLDEIESRLVKVETKENGKVVFVAKREDFPAAAHPVKCAKCEYQLVCSEGREACGLHPAPQGK